MNKVAKIALGGVAAVALVGGGIGLARATSGTEGATSSTPSASSSVSVVAPGEQHQGGQMPGGQPPADGQMPGQPPADGQMPPGGPGGGMAQDLAMTLGIDADKVKTALEELHTESKNGQPMHPGSADFASALASKLGLDEATVTEALGKLTPPEPPQGGQPGHNGQPGNGSQQGRPGQQDQAPGSASSATPKKDA